MNISCLLRIKKNCICFFSSVLGENVERVLENINVTAVGAVTAPGMSSTDEYTAINPSSNQGKHLFYTAIVWCGVISLNKIENYLFEIR